MKMRWWRLSIWAAAFAVIVLGVAAVSTAAGQEGDEEGEPVADSVSQSDGPSDEVLILGSRVYADVCSSCHQPRGVGVDRQFPPLAGNPRVDDTDYVREVILTGLEGELEVAGTVYDARMPAFSTLTDDEVDAVIAFVQSGFEIPTGAATDTGPGPSSTDLPDLANMAYLIALAIALGVGALVLWPRFVSTWGDRLEMPWLDAWLKAIAIVVWFVVFTVYVPSEVMKTETVADLDRNAQDAVGAGLWLAGMAAGMWAVWYASRQRRI